jgi:hypothetical protein
MPRYRIEICVDALNDGDAEYLADELTRRTRSGGYNTADRAMTYRSVPVTVDPSGWKWLEEIKSEELAAKSASRTC